VRGLGDRRLLRARALLGLGRRHAAAPPCATTLRVEKRELLDRISTILRERETLDRLEFEALVDGTPEEEVFREKDEKRRQSGGSKPTPQRPPRRPQVTAPAPVTPMLPKTT
jgi:hypothetical protein